MRPPLFASSDRFIKNKGGAPAHSLASPVVPRRSGRLRKQFQFFFLKMFYVRGRESKRNAGFRESKHSRDELLPSIILTLKIFGEPVETFDLA